jgi:hypothetical protein
VCSLVPANGPGLPKVPTIVQYSSGFRQLSYANRQSARGYPCINPPSGRGRGGVGEKGRGRMPLPARGLPHAHPLLMPLDGSRTLRTAGSARRLDAPAQIFADHAAAGSMKMLAASASHHESVRRLHSVHGLEPELRPSTSAPQLLRGTGGSFTSAPPRDLLASRGAQFRISALDKPTEPTDSGDCQQCVAMRQQIKGLKRRLSSVRYADEHLTRDADELRSERDGLQAIVNKLQQQLAQESGQTSVRSELGRVKMEMQETQQKHLEMLEEKDSRVAEMLQIIINRDDAIQQHMKKHDSLQSDLRNMDQRRRGAEFLAAKAQQALLDTQKQLQVLQAGLTNDREVLLQTQNQHLSARLLEAEEHARQRCDEFHAMLSALQELERSAADSEETLRMALEAANCREAEMRCMQDESRAVVGIMKQERDDARHQLECSDAERDRNMLLLARENGDLCEKVASTQGQVEMLSQKIAVLEERNVALEHQVRQVLADCSLLTKKSAALEKRVTELRSDAAKRVVVVTPKICVSVSAGQLEEVGKLDLPVGVLQKLVAKQLGYEPDELFKAEDEASIANIDFDRPRLRPGMRTG